MATTTVMPPMPALAFNSAWRRVLADDEPALEDLATEIGDFDAASARLASSEEADKDLAAAVRGYFEKAVRVCAARSWSAYRTRGVTPESIPRRDCNRVVALARDISRKIDKALENEHLEDEVRAELENRSAHLAVLEGYALLETGQLWAARLAFSDLARRASEKEHGSVARVFRRDDVQQVYGTALATSSNLDDVNEAVAVLTRVAENDDSRYPLHRAYAKWALAEARHRLEPSAHDRHQEDLVNAHNALVGVRDHLARTSSREDHEDTLRTLDLDITLIAYELKTLEGSPEHTEAPLILTLDQQLLLLGDQASQLAHPSGVPALQGAVASLAAAFADDTPHFTPDPASIAFGGARAETVAALLDVHDRLATVIRTAADDAGGVSPGTSEHTQLTNGLAQAGKLYSAVFETLNREASLSDDARSAIVTSKNELQVTLGGVGVAR